MKWNSSNICCVIYSVRSHFFPATVSTNYFSILNSLKTKFYLFSKDLNSNMKTLILFFLISIISFTCINTCLSLTSTEDEDDDDGGGGDDGGATSPCNITTFHGHGRNKRSSSKRGHGVLVCITANEDNVKVHGPSSNKHKSHHQDDDNDSSDSSSTENGKGDDDDDSDETEEQTSHSSTHNTGSSNSNRHQHHGSGKLPSKSNKGRRKGVRDNTRVIIEEQFTYRNWSTEWIHAKNANGSKVYNKFSRVYARKSNHSRPNYGIITNNKGGEFYMIATSFPPFNNRNDTLVLQFSVQFQSRAHCQLAFLRLYDCQFSTDDFGIQTPYLMQVGPYICGTSGMNKLSAEFQEPGKTTIRSVDKNVEPVNNTSVNTYALALEADGTYHIILNTNSTQNGTLKDHFPNYKGYTSICAVGLLVWHSVLDKYFKGQMIVDDVLVVNDMKYADKQRKQILNLYSE